MVVLSHPALPHRALLRRVLQALALIGVLAAQGWQAAPTQGAVPAEAEEYRIKAAFLYKFAAYVEWPPASFESSDSPLVFGVLGAGALADDLARIAAGHTVNGRPVEVRELHHGDPLGELHVLFVGRAAGARLPEVLAAAAGRPLLTVTESDAALELGSTINFVIVDDRVRFDVAVPAADQGGIRISSRLLSVARRVITSPS